MLLVAMQLLCSRHFAVQCFSYLLRMCVSFSSMLVLQRSRRCQVYTSLFFDDTGVVWVWHAREFVELGHSVTALLGAETREAAEGRFFVQSEAVLQS